MLNKLFLSTCVIACNHTHARLKITIIISVMMIRFSRQLDANCPTIGVFPLFLENTNYFGLMSSSFHSL